MAATWIEEPFAFRVLGRGGFRDVDAAGSARIRPGVHDRDRRRIEPRPDLRYGLDPQVRLDLRQGRRADPAHAARMSSGERNGPSARASAIRRASVGPMCGNEARASGVAVFGSSFSSRSAP